MKISSFLAGSLFAFFWIATLVPSGQASCAKPQETALVPSAVQGGDEFGSAVAIDGDRLVVAGPNSDSAGSPSPVTSFNILMIGNSYTQGVGSAPPGGVTEDLQGLFDADPTYAATVSERAMGGWTLLTHFGDPTTRDLIEDTATYSWDIVCLQEQSTRPGRAIKFGGADLANLDAGGPPLIDLIRQNHPGARVVLYNTWAREPGNSSLVTSFNNDPLEMLSFTNLGYDRVRSNPPAWDHSDIVSIARVGDAWQQWYSDYSYSSVERLHAGDGTHQNQRGSYLAAALLFETITGKSSIGNPFAGSYLGGVSGAIGGVSTLLLLQQYATATSAALRMDTGSVVVFERSSGLWSETQRLSPLDAEAFGRFGASVAIDGDRLAVGAPAADGGRGAIYLFEVNPLGDWVQTAQVTATGGAPGDEFGSSLALSGNRLAVGAPERDIIGFQFHAEAGTAYVFVESGGQWSQEARLEAPDASSMDDFGRALVLSSDSLLVGAPGDDDVGVDAGSVYAYTRTGTSWTLDGEVRALDTAGGDEFGRALDLDGSLAIVGAPGDDEGALNAGSATILEQSVGQWTAVATLRPSSPGLTDAAGSSVALRGGLALVGTPFDDPLGSDSGSVTLFRQVGFQWPEVETLTASDGLLGDAFGTAVALGESEAVVGAPLSNGVGADSGSAYHFDLVDPLSEFFSFCFGDGGDGTGCTACPCGNDAPSGSGGGCLNEAGQSSRLILSGGASVGADTLRFTLENANPSTFAILFSGASRAPANAANPCFGADSGVTSPALNGLRCAVQQVLRHGTRPTDSAGAVGLTTAGWGAPNGPPGGLLASGGFVAGQTRHFQVIYRETPTATCTTDQNTSQGVTVIVTP